MTIEELLSSHGTNASNLSKKMDIPYTTVSTAFSKSVDKWSVKLLRATADALELDIDELLNVLKQESNLSPFIKWVGGKRQLLSTIDDYLPKEFNRYYEPFIGGGAVFLHLRPAAATINDFNFELVNTWKVVKEQPDELLALLEKHKINNSKDYYLDLRLADRDGRLESMTPVERAARFIYMNKTGFNGLYRVNSKGQNNVPYGKYKNPTIVSPMIKSVSEYMNSNDIEINNLDYKYSVAEAEEGDFVYFDPPYIPVSLTSSFTSYTSDGFGLAQQKELRDTALDLTGRGVKVMLSNSDVELISEIYSDPVFKINHIQATRMINSNAAKRGKVGEVIITNY
ncbi:Dam family site-specific DNA-(adenine-N6)-methyltransferase [Companilactobacillus mishanensis]|uniref:Dam family site-specific DNA-(adenine-N6)-methyltransferase n=1 Tax=Companilactobacillus mishanensis TaxID=2486008 RepID=UPI0012965A50|nr:Dam family site-specific DNA-(adenine-N6)-methyltransferase [Companilactobacillus mishanensis]MQS89575.1 DNA adenine methylase [Companilactobacillus mishanensis]